MRLLIGICGRARHGKDSTALAIKNRLEAQGVSCFYSSISSVVFDDAKALGLIQASTREACTARDLATLVEHGHQGRENYNDYWVVRLDDRIPDGTKVAIVPGIRFPNEVEWVRRRHGILLRVTRLNADGSLFISPDRDPNNRMETCLNRLNADFEITAKTGQDDWLRLQGESFASFVVERYLYEPNVASASADFVPALRRERF